MCYLVQGLRLPLKFVFRSGVSYERKIASLLPVLVLLCACAVESVHSNTAQTPGHLIDDNLLADQSLVNQSRVNESFAKEPLISQSLVKEIRDWQTLGSEPLVEGNITKLTAPQIAKRHSPVARGITVQLVAAPVEQVLHTLANDAHTA